MRSVKDQCVESDTGMILVSDKVLTKFVADVASGGDVKTAIRDTGVDHGQLINTLRVKFRNSDFLGLTPKQVVDVALLLGDDEILKTAHHKFVKMKSMGESMAKKVVEFEIEDIGLESSSYFTGRGTAYSEWDEVFTGVGSTPKDALDDAAEQIANNGEWELPASFDEEAKKYGDTPMVGSSISISGTLGSNDMLGTIDNVDGHATLIGTSFHVGKKQEIKETSSFEVDDGRFHFGMTTPYGKEDVIEEFEKLAGENGIVLTEEDRAALNKELNWMDMSEHYYHVAIYVKGGEGDTESKDESKQVTERHGKGFVENHPDLADKLKSVIESEKQDIERKYDTFGGHDVEEVEHKSRDGFMSSNDGGYQWQDFSATSVLMGSGISLPTEKAQAGVDSSYEYGLKLALDGFKEKYAKELEGIPEDKINYHDLIELKKSDLAEKLSEMENEANADDTVMFDIKCFMRDDGDQGITWTVQGAVNWEAPYHRPKAWFEDFKQIEVEFKDAEDMHENFQKVLDAVKECAKFLVGGHGGGGKPTEAKDLAAVSQKTESLAVSFNGKTYGLTEDKNVVSEMAQSPIKEGDYVKVKSGESTGKTGVVVRVRDNSGEAPNSISVVITGSGFDHGIWFSEDDLKKVGSKKKEVKEEGQVVEASDSEPRVYVGTYAKYNDGSIKGKWLDLNDYADKDDFLEACKELHKDEADPELMFQDFEGFPEEFYNESSISDKLWDWLKLDEEQRELLEVYVDMTGDKNATIEQAEEAFQGKYDSEVDWAQQFLDDTGMPGADQIGYYITISDMDARLIGQEEADAQLEGMSDDDIIEKAEMVSEYEAEEDEAKKQEILDAAREEASSKISDEIEERIKKDPVGYFVDDLGAYTVEELAKQNFVSFDYEAYARDARLGGDVSFVEHKGDTWVFWNH